MSTVADSDRRDLGRLSLAVAVVWLAWWFHDFREFAGTAGLTPDAIVGGVIYLSLLALIWWTPSARLPRLALLVFTGRSRVGGALSLLPLPGRYD